MKRYISIMLIVFLFVTTTLGSMSVFADTEIDETAPVISTISLVNGDDFNSADGTLNVKIGLIEEGTGLTELQLDFGAAEFMWETFYEDDEECAEDPILFTGSHQISLNRQNAVPIGEYELTYLAARDVNGNWFTLQSDDIKTHFGTVPVLNVTSTNYTQKWVNLKSFEFLQTENIDASKPIKATFSFDANINIGNICLNFYDEAANEHETVSYELTEENMLSPGTHTIAFPLNNELTTGKKVLYGIDFNYGYWVEIDSTLSNFSNTIINVTKGKTPIVPPDILDINISNTELTAPAVLKMNLNIKANGNPINYISLSYKTEKGKSVYLTGDVEKVSAGHYSAKIPIGPFLTEGKMRLEAVRVDYVADDVHAGYGNTKWRDVDTSLIEKGDFSVNSGYNITYFGSLGNSKVVSVLKKMNDGETAVLDIRNTKNAKKEVFEAIAGRDITVAFVDDNVQWVFNGKDIKKSKCKKINLKSTIKVVSGSSAGFPDDTKVAKLIFQNNGQLPGEVEMRINYDYLAEKYKFKKENLKLTYLDSNQNATVEDSNVDMAKDHYYEYEVDHNSTFVLSKTKAKIGKTTVTAVPNGLKSVKIKWKKKAGNGYYVYRATKKDGKYKKIATIKKNTTLTYVDKNVKKGKTYYYKVKPYSKKTAFNKTAKMSKPCKAYTRLKAPKIDTCKKVKNKLRVRLEWYGVKDAKYYEVYRSTTKNGTYKKVYTEKKSDTNYYIDKKVKKGKTYYYKIKAIYKKNSKYNSKLGAYKSVTVK